MRRPFLTATLLAALTLPPAVAPAAESFDIVIKGGRVIDPASGRDQIADVGLRGGAIAAISTKPLSGKTLLDARGLVVAPGFIDLHSHAMDLKGERSQLLDGVTTAIDMEMGAMPITTFFATMRGRALINYGASAAHICARIEVISATHCTGHAVTVGAMTMDAAALEQAATPAQESQIVAALDREIGQGALGYGIGLEYTPGAGRREIFRVFQAAAATHAPVFVHLRSRPLDKAPGVPLAVVDEVLADAAASGAALQIVHVTSTAQADAPVAIELIKGAHAHGVDVTAEAYPYEAGNTQIGSAFFSEGWQERNGVTYKDVLWAATGERLTQASFARYRAEQPNGSAVIFSIPPEAIDAAISDPFVSIASDASTAHPRGAGAFSRVLGVFVRERKLLDLKTALAKMTIMPARRLEKISPQMLRKGRLAVGADADITVFDPATIKDMATFEKPTLPSVGIRYVLVGGKVMADNGKVTPDTFPGVGIRSAPAR